jgi:hypothetical protein
MKHEINFVANVTGFFALTMKSRNRKTGPIPVSTSHNGTCPNSCLFKKNGCYGDGGHIRRFWDKVSAGKAGGTWLAFLGAVLSIKEGQLWRLNQVGDLPPNIAECNDEQIDPVALSELVEANKGKRGFGFTHYSIEDTHNFNAVMDANLNGLTINASCNGLDHADELAEIVYYNWEASPAKSKFPSIPLATVLPEKMGIQDGESLADYKKRKPTVTPMGHKLTICPATYMDTNCKDCGLCSIYKRETIVGFPAHGISVKKADAVASAPR